MTGQTILLLGFFQELDAHDFRVLAMITLFAFGFYVIRKLVFIIGAYISRDRE